MENIDPNNHSNDDICWREIFIDYYETNAPAKLSMVNDAMMTKWEGKYELLMANLVKKYGVLGSPIQQPPRRPARGSAGGPKNSKSTNSELNSKFKTLISNSTPTLPSRDANINVVESKASNSENGLETSTFTVCTRVRPLLGQELIAGGGVFTAVVPGLRTDLHSPSIHTEELLLHAPKVSVMGKAKLDTTAHLFDYVFGPDSTNQEIYNLACAPLVKRALNGQIGVIFAYGQTGSGKTHTMSGILDILATSDIFSDLTDVTFSYIEMLGREIKDCLPVEEDGNAEKETKGKGVKIGEGVNGSVLIRNMATHTVEDADQLGIFIKRANSTRATAMTAKNDSSSRSHGVAILKVKNRKTAVEGTLYVIDLAGSESAKDSKDHTKDRMNETKEINSSLMVLKECIRARTSAAGVGNGDIHVPYRRNKLTLLMKDVFDIGCSRLCSTVVIAACSPLASDIDHTSSTVKYAAPLRVAVAASNKQKNLELDVHDPALWTSDEIVSWVKSVDSGSIDAKVFVNNLTGVQFCSLPENEFYARAEAQLGDEEGMMEIAKSLYLGLWTLIVDAKTRKRRPDGSIITPEQEEEERRQLDLKTLEKARVWAEREKHLKG
jgi:kinesin family protein 2/24